MKKITVSLLALCVVSVVGAQNISKNTDPVTAQGNNQTQIERSGTDIVLTQSVNPLDVTDGGVACWDSMVTGEYRDNSFYRAYVLADFGVDPSIDYEVVSVEWGQGSADDNNVLDLNVYSADTDDLGFAVLNLLGTSQRASNSADDLTLIQHDVTADNIIIPAGTTVAVFEVFSPDGGTATDVRFFPGNNADGQNAPSYLRADACGITVPTPVGDVVAEDESYVMNMVISPILSVDDNLLSQVAVFPNPATDIVNIKTPSSVQIQSVSIFDVLGKETVANVVNGQINISDLSRGVYIMNIRTNQGVLTEKIVKR